MRYIINTLGCKVNQYETQAMETLLRERGHEPAAEDSEADIVIVNSCAVTAESGRKSRQALRRLMERYPNAKSAVCGCWAQTEPDAAEAIGADIVWGSGDRRGFVEALERAVAEDARERSVDRPFERRIIEDLPAGAFSGHARAYLKLEDGCQNFCSYCIIPYARGRVRSLPVERAAQLAAELAGEGYRELVLTGIEIASYGEDLPDTPGLADAVCAIAEAAPELRLRLGSLEPTVVTEDFCRRLAETGRVCDHFHLSLQSGCDRTLSRMRRKYGTAEFFAVTERLRRYFPHCGLTADLITGFPGETEEDHRATMEFIESCAFSSMHVFPYSRRPGTPADRLPEQLTARVKSARAAEAHALAERMKAEYLQSCVGMRLETLFETEQNGMSTGHASNYAEVCVPGTGLRGVVRNVQIEAVLGEMLVGAAI